MNKAGKWAMITGGVLAVLVAGGALLYPTVTQASLPVGAMAPDFATRGALAGKVFNLKLSDALKKGPVVLYFFPAAFTPGCTAETKEFADQHDAFAKAGATVIGMSADPVDKLAKFSVEACRNKFAVASAGPKVIEGYNVALAVRPGMTNRTSYVIAPTGRIAYAFSDLGYKDHVKNTLAAVQSLKAVK
jgi:thioredoxin-dependent peroxiredoxin